ncbi:MAG: glycosyl transferase [Planctomycetota bacterium]
MSEPLSIAFVAPPYGGHLFPQLQLAEGLRENTGYDIHFYSTPEAEAAVRLSGFEFVAVLSKRSHEVIAISDTPRRVGSNPLHLYRQFESNLALMAQLKSELRERWEASRPELVIADFTVPIAGLLASEMGVRWWTSMPTPCAMETGDGTPTYLGGWMPPTTVIGRIRDAAGRVLIRGFKRSVHRMFRRKLVELGVPRIYRDDGLEVIYSGERVLAMGWREFEFERNWPNAVQFIGPLTRSPSFDHVPPIFEEGKRHVLVSLGTHLWWAKGDARELVREVARAMPDCVFHFSDGRHRDDSDVDYPVIDGNFHRYKYLPYDRYMDRYSAAIHHGGTGVMYCCLELGIAALVWPQDYDQFDHAARLIHRGLGKRLRPNITQIVTDLRTLLQDSVIHERLREFQEIARRYDPRNSLAQQIEPA